MQYGRRTLRVQLEAQTTVEPLALSSVETAQLTFICPHPSLPVRSENTPTGRNVNKLTGTTLLNGNSVAMLVPGSAGPEV